MGLIQYVSHIESVIVIIPTSLFCLHTCKSKRRIIKESLWAYAIQQWKTDKPAFVIFSFIPHCWNSYQTKDTKQNYKKYMKII